MEDRGNIEWYTDNIRFMDKGGVVVGNFNPNKGEDKYKIRYTEDTGINYGVDWTHPRYIAYLEEQLAMADKHIKYLEQRLRIQKGL